MPDKIAIAFMFVCLVIVVIFMLIVIAFTLVTAKHIVTDHQLTYRDSNKLILNDVRERFK